MLQIPSTQNRFAKPRHFVYPPSHPSGGRYVWHFQALEPRPASRGHLACVPAARRRIPGPSEEEGRQRRRPSPFQLSRLRFRQRSPHERRCHIHAIRRKGSCRRRLRARWIRYRGQSHPPRPPPHQIQLAAPLRRHRRPRRNSRSAPQPRRKARCQTPLRHCLPRHPPGAERLRRHQRASLRSRIFKGLRSPHQRASMGSRAGPRQADEVRLPDTYVGSHPQRVEGSWRP